MKKAVFSIIVLLLTLCAVAQKPASKLVVPDLPIDEKTQLVTYQDVIKQEGTPKVLYDRAMAWVKKYYKNTTEVIKNAAFTHLAYLFSYYSIISFHFCISYKIHYIFYFFFTF